MPSAAKIMEMRAEPSRCPEPAEGLLELCRVQPKLLKYNKQFDCVKIFLNSLAIQKNLCLASYLLNLFLERKKLIEGPLILNCKQS